MFTGIITEIGTLVEARPSEGGRNLDIACSWTDLVPGESVAVDGACLTVARLGEGSFGVHVVRTSLDPPNHWSISEIRRDSALVGMLRCNCRQCADVIVAEHSYSPS